MFNRTQAVVVGCIGLCTLWSLPARAETVEARTVKVTGSADVRVVPNEVVITVRVESQKATIELAQSDNDERIKRVLEVARGEGIAEQHLQTDFVQVAPWYQYVDNEQKQVGFVAHKSVAITLRDVSKFEALVHKLLAAGVNHVDNVDFRTTELRKHKDEARKLAIAAAREKAAALAAELGQGIGRPVTIEEERKQAWFYAGWGGFSRGGGMGNVNRMAESGEPGVDMSTMALGQITVNAEVTVCFELQDAPGA